MQSKLLKRHQDTFVSHARSLARNLREIADGLDKMSTACKATRVGCKVAQLAGLGINLLASGAAPFSFGLSSAALPVGTAMMAVGTGVDLGSSLLEKFVSKVTITSAERSLKCLKSSRISLLEIYDDFLQIKQSFVDAKNTCESFRGLSSLEAGSTPLSASPHMEKVMSSAESFLPSFAAEKLAGVMSKVALPVSVMSLVDSCVELYNSKGSPAGKKLRELADALEEWAEGTLKALDDHWETWTNQGLNYVTNYAQSFAKGIFS